MARREKPWWWAARRCYYVIVGGQRHRLDPDREAAYRAWHAIAARAAGSEATAPPHTTRPSEMTMQRLCDGYLAASKLRVGRHRVKTIASLLGLLTRVWGGGRCVAAITKADFDAVRKARRWAPTTATLARRTFAAACNSLAIPNPLAGLRTGRGRTRDLVLPTAEQIELLLRRANWRLRDVIEALYDTGARPCEVFSVTAADVRGDRWVLRESKSGRPRVIYLTDRVRERCRELAAIHPTGPLYRNRDRPWPLYSTAPAKAFTRLRIRCGLPSGVTLYSLRHAFATDAIEKGVPEAAICSQLGNTPAVLTRHYVHLRGRDDATRDVVRRTRGGS